MKRKRLLLALAACALLLAAPLTLLAGGFLLPAQYDSAFLGELKYKCQRLDETEGQRIVFVGGSAVAFGIDSALVEEELPDYTAVNFGLYAALGTKVMLELSQDSIREGDIVILLPEQQEQALSCYVNGEALWQGLDGAFYLLGRLERADWDSLAGQFPTFAARKLGYVLSGDTPALTGVYSRASFNEYGDIVAEDCTNNIMSGGYDSTTPILFREDLPEEDFVTVLNEYIDTLTARGATVWYYFCPMNALAVEEGVDLDGYYDSLQSKLHCYVLGDPSNSVLEAEWFYDTNFHLNASGKTVYTRQLIRDIKAMLGDTSPTDIALPDQPALAEIAAAQGDNSDAGCFRYEIQDGEAVLTGLTEEGQHRTTLTVPTELEGCPVTALGADVLAGNTALRSVTLQAGLSTIEDGAFRGCTALMEIILEGMTPSDCLVGQGLLEGTKATIYVEAEQLTAFRLDYTWSQYAGRITAR